MSLTSEKGIDDKEDLRGGIVILEEEVSPGCVDCDSHKRTALDAQAALTHANARIKELEEQVAILTIKATSAVDKLADYEDKLKRLSSGAALRALPTHPTTTTPDRSILQSHRKSRSYTALEVPDEQPRPATADGVIMPTPVQDVPDRDVVLPTPVQTQESRPSQFGKFTSFSNFWSGKKNVQQEERSGSPTPARRQGEAQLILLDKSTESVTSDVNTVPSAKPSTIKFQESRPPTKRSISTGSTASIAVSAASTSLSDELSRERNLRLAAEQKLVALQTELEDLSTSLFEQANTMVADERRLRAKVEAKAAKLEERHREAQERLRESAGRREEAGRLREERIQRLRVLEERIGKVERVRRVVQGVG